ncbi:hypothetical protein D3C86_1610230 [compost metagenome]
MSNFHAKNQADKDIVRRIIVRVRLFLHSSVIKEKLTKEIIEVHTKSNYLSYKLQTI